MKPNQALDERQIKEDSEKLREYYQKAGYNQVSVNYTIDRDRIGGFGTVTFKIREGAKVKIADIKFVGQRAREGRGKLQGVIETKKWWMFSWLTGLRPFQGRPVRRRSRETARLLSRTGLSRRRNSAGQSAVQLSLTGEAGPRHQHHRRPAVSASATSRFPATNCFHVRSSAPRRAPEAAAWFSCRPRSMRTVSGSMTSMARTAISTRASKLLRKPNVATGNIDIEYKIQESEKFNVESIVIEGNTKTKSTVILRELVLGPGDVFSTVLMKISQLRLDNTRFFEERGR